MTTWGEDRLDLEENDPADEESAEARSGNVSASVEAVEGVSELTLLSPRRERSKM